MLHCVTYYDLTVESHMIRDSGWHHLTVRSFPLHPSNLIFSILVVCCDFCILLYLFLRKVILGLLRLMSEVWNFLSLLLRVKV